MHYWLPNVPGVVCQVPCSWPLALLPSTGFSVKGFGEAEFWCSMLKVVTIIAFIIVGFLMIWGIMTNPDNSRYSPGLNVFMHGDGPLWAAWRPLSACR
jgi:lysine-specific permease